MRYVVMSTPPQTLRHVLLLAMRVVVAEAHVVVAVVAVAEALHEAVVVAEAMPVAEFHRMMTVLMHAVLMVGMIWRTAVRTTVMDYRTMRTTVMD